MNNPFEYTPGEECNKAFAGLLAIIVELKLSPREEDQTLCRELEDGKMLGVLIAEDVAGVRHTLYAFSGQLRDAGFHHRVFVEPAFDYLDPEGYFKKKEAEISDINRGINHYQTIVLADARKACAEAEKMADKELQSWKELFVASKEARARRRNIGDVSSEEAEAMIRQSQYEKAELRRIKKRIAANLTPFKNALWEAERILADKKRLRHKESETLQQWLFDNFILLNGRGESRSLSDIFADTTMKTPPSGAGECCGPKLLQAAFIRGWRPLEMAEYWYGAPKNGEIRIHGQHYPACRGKCLPILRWMLEGVEVTPSLDGAWERTILPEPSIIFENEWFCVIDKPSGMLSVPGRISTISVEEWLQKRYGESRYVKSVHRLDQDTSGLLIVAFSEEVYKSLQAMFARREISKTYIALLEGDYRQKDLPVRGLIDLPLSPDWLDRPRQRVDKENGKPSQTEYEFLGTKDGMSRIAFHPLTGRTHQLRVHAASPEGLGMPIAGDRLYGTGSKECPDRLHLHAHRLTFRFPLDHTLYTFESPAPF